MSRAQATNGMLAAKLRWFYTNEMPQCEAFPSNNFLELVQNMSTELRRQRTPDVVTVGLRQIEQVFSNMDTPNTDSENSIQDANVARPSVITFTNKGGDVVSNAAVLSWNAVDVFYEVPGGGSRVHISDLPTDLQQAFKYNRKKADIFKAREQSRQGIIAAEKSVAGERLAAQVANAKFADSVKATKVAVCGRVIQKMNDGTLLVDSGSAYYGQNWWYTSDGIKGVWGTVLVVGDSQAVDGDTVCLTVYPDGEWTYTTVTGASKTVRRFQCYGGLVTHVVTEEEVQRMTTR